MNRNDVKLVVVIVLSLLISACSSSGIPMGAQHAGAYIGGALSNFTGPDGGDSYIRSTAREIAVSRIYDMTATGFILASGAATSTPGGFGDYGNGSGTVTIQGAGQESTMELDVISLDPSVSNIHMIGRFSSADAQTAIDSAGASFTVFWEFSWDQFGTTYEVSAEQVLTGTDWV